MSAFQVSENHICALIGIAQALHRDGYGSMMGDSPFDHPVAFFEAIASLNARSVGYRYAEDVEPVPVPEGRLNIEPARLRTIEEVVAAIKLVDCYEYQACEVPGYEASTVGCWISKLRLGLIRRLPGYEAAYSSAPWAI